MRRKGGLGWVPWGGAPTPEQRFLQGLSLGGLTVYDVGGFEGLTTMFFARAAGHVVVYEPSAATRRRLTTNLALNDLRNVTVRPVGLGADAAVIPLVHDPLMPGGASAAPEIAEQIGGTASTATLETITVVTLDDELAGGSLPTPDFIKIDVEGMEVDVIAGASRTLQEHRPALHIELHGATEVAKRTNAKAVVDTLRGLGYTSILHVESGQTVGREPPIRGHLYCANQASASRIDVSARETSAP